jgi:hypothetical protein
MRHRIYQSVVSWPFICALTILLVNDWWLKFICPGLISGKLSDFAGIALVGFSLLALWPRHTRKIYLAISATFLWWKSPLSEPLIQLVNECMPFSIDRTVDYTDLVALTILPVCSYVLDHNRRFLLPWPMLRRLLFLPVIVATAFGTMATSVIPARQDYEVRRTGNSEELQREQVNKIVASVAASNGLTCQNCPRADGSMVYIGRGITMRYTFRATDAIAFEIESWPGFLWFGSSGRDKADALQSDLKAALADQFKGLEFVEQLKPNHRY